MMNEKPLPPNQRDDSTGRLILVSLIAVGFLIAVQVALFFSLRRWFPGWQERGQFGDMFGALNPLFSGLGFFALVYTLVLQRRQLQAQMDEIHIVRQEFEDGAEARRQERLLLEQEVAATKRSNELAALNFLIGFYEKRQAKLKRDEDEGLGKTTLYEEQVEVTGRLLRLYKKLDRVYGETTSN